MNDTSRAQPCPNCGALCEKDANFCAACGARLRKYDSAVGGMIDDLRRRLDDSPDNPDLHYNLALAYIEARDLPAARIALRRVIELMPDFADPHIRLARLEIELGDNEQAKALLTKALAIDPANTSAKRLRESLGP